MRRSLHEDRLTDRLLAGDVDAAGAPAELAGVAALIQAAQAPATPDEVAVPTGLLAAMQEAVLASSGETTTSRASRLTKLLSAKLAAIAVVTVVGATGAAAATGALPAPAQTRVADALSHVGVALPKPANHGTDAHRASIDTTVPGAPAPAGSGSGNGSESEAGGGSGPIIDTGASSTTAGTTADGVTGTTAATGVGPDATGAARLGLCTAAHVGADGSLPEHPDSVAIRNLSEAASAANLDVRTFCRDAAAGQSTDAQGTTSKSDGSHGSVPVGSSTTEAGVDGTGPDRSSKASTTTTGHTSGDGTARAATSTTSTTIRATTTSGAGGKGGSDTTTVDTGPGTTTTTTTRGRASTSTVSGPTTTTLSSRGNRRSSATGQAS